MKWSYGVTTVPARFADLLPATLDYLQEAGFPSPRIFIDGKGDYPGLALPFTQRIPRVGAYGNWLLSMWELYIRVPDAQRFAIFQDDIIAPKNLRGYLDRCEFPARGYLNLYTFPENEKPGAGWHRSNQLGRGALGLVFSRNGIQKLLAHKHMVMKPASVKKPDRSLDGAVVTSMADVGWAEYVHSPSLLQHAAPRGSTIGNSAHPLAESFVGADYNLDDLATSKKSPTKARKKPTHRIGLVGYNCKSGLGVQNRHICTHADIDRWLVKPHPKYPTCDPHEDVDSTHCPTGVKMAAWLKTVDTVMFVESPLYPELIKEASRAKKRIVCIPNQEWMPEGRWTGKVDRYVCPTQYTYDQFCDKLPCVHFSWPVDVARFEHRRREWCKRFLFLNGNGGWQGRKGGDVIRELIRKFPEIPLTIRSQKKGETWPKGKFVTVEPPLPNNRHIYDAGDVLLAPHYVDGIGLEPMEAMAAGMPVVTTDGRPWNEWPALARIPAERTKKKIIRHVDWFLPSAESLAGICKELLGKGIKRESEKARQWAEERRWEAKAQEFNSLVRGET